MSVRDYPVSFSLELNVENAYVEARKLQTVLFRGLGLARRLTGSENLQKSIDVMLKATAIANRLRLALRAVQLARMAAGDPLAWALAGISVAEVGMDIATELDGR